MTIWNSREIKKLKGDPYDYPWEDLRFPAQIINPTGQDSPPGVESASSGLLLFDAASTEVIAGVAQMTHGWAEGTVIEPHVHWQKTTSAGGDVLWQFDYEVVNNGDVALMTYASQKQAVSTIIETPDNDTANELLISSFGEIDMTGFQISCIMFWKVSRIGGDGSDTYGADARLVEFDIHYRRDSGGSYSPYSKLKKGYKEQKGTPKKEFKPGAW